MGDIENELRKTQLLWEQLPNLAKELELSRAPEKKVKLRVLLVYLRIAY